MEIEKVGNKIIASHELEKDETCRIRQGGRIQSLTIIKKPLKVKGYANTTGDGMAILTIDYDDIYYNIVLEDYKIIQKKFKLPPAYIFSTKERARHREIIGSYHVVCLKKFTHAEIFDILKHTRCDINYTSMPLRNPYKNWVLRMSNKGNRERPKFIQMVGENKNLNEKVSLAHKKLLTKIYPTIKHPNYQNTDNLKKVRIHVYETLN